MPIEDVNAFTVTELKEKLKVLKQTTTGTKTELINRLMATDPTGSWMSSNGVATVENNVDDADVEDMRVGDRRTDGLASTGQEQNLMLQRELELCRREKKLARTRDCATRADAACKNSQWSRCRLFSSVTRNPDRQGQEAMREVMSRINITQIADLLRYFDDNTDNLRLGKGR